MSTKTSRTRTKPARKATAAVKARSKSAGKSSAAKSKSPLAPSPTDSKQAQLIALLRSPAGTTIEQLTSLTGWQPHTVRGTISGVLRKRMGLQVSCDPAADGGSRVYRIVNAAA